MPFDHGDVWERSETTVPGRPRLCIGTSRGHADLIAALSATWTTPLKVLYVHVVPRTPHDAGRYESPWVSPEEAASFLHRFARFLAEDGRAHVWFAAPDEALSPLVVWDRHDLLHVYGDLDAAEAVLRARGFRPGTVSIPSPHSHWYHAENDPDAAALFAWWPWERSPLRPDDD